MIDKCREAFLEDWIESPFNRRRYFIFKRISYKIFRAGWNNYMGSPIPSSIEKILSDLDENHVLRVWFSLGYLKGKWQIEGRPKCDICGEPVHISIGVGEEKGEETFEEKVG